MATPIKMPQLGMTMTEATVVQWLKREGDTVRKGEPVASIETDKLNAEVEASADGMLRRIVAPEGAIVPVVGLMGVIAAPDEPEAAVEALVGGAGGTAQAVPTPPARATAVATTATTPPATAGASRVRATAEVADENLGDATEPEELPAPAPQPVGAGQAEVRASPIAKRLAAEHGVNLTTIQGSGPAGRIVEADVRAAALADHGALINQGTTAAAPLHQVERGPGGEVETDGFVRASPLARRLAREQGLNLRRVRGTGPEGRVVERDILAAAQALTQPAAAAPSVTQYSALSTQHLPSGLTPRETFRLDGMRRVIAERMHQSLQQMAQLTLTTEADATALVELRSHLIPAAKVFGHRAPTYTDLIVAIVAKALTQHPLLNSSLLPAPPDQARPSAPGKEVHDVVCWQQVNIGVAVALDRGLIVPVIRDADQKPLQVISEELGDLAEGARANRLTVDDLQGGTFTITNLGQLEVDGFTPIINPPQCAILGVGRIAKKPAVYEDQLAVRQMVTLSLSFDHRIVDGVPAGAFLRDVKRAIEAAQL